MERYHAFIEDYPTSPHAPVVWASLIRDLIALNKIDVAQSELDNLKRAHPGHQATKRATGEVYRATAVGTPFGLMYKTPTGETVRSMDYVGKVLVGHFWASWSRRSLDELPQVTKLYEDYKDRGLQLIGINVDKSRRRIEETLKKFPMPWPQYFDGKGLENDILIGTGVINVPTYFVVDRDGILRGIDPGDKLTSLVQYCLDQPVTKAQPPATPAPPQP
jgi:thiol-disulfide isomerase/thioredoxin